MIIWLLYLILCAVAHGAGDHDDIITTKMLSDFGYKSGFTLTTTDNTKQVYWHIPAPISLNNAQVQLHVSYNVQKGGADTLQVLVNDHPIQTVVLPTHPEEQGEQTTMLTMTIPDYVFDKGVALITFRFVGSTGSQDNRNICASSNYMTLLPESIFQAQFDWDNITTYEQTLNLLSKAITVFISPTDRDGQNYQTALLIGSRLKNLGFTVDFISLPQHGDKLRLTTQEQDIYRTHRTVHNERAEPFVLQSDDDLLQWIQIKTTTSKSKAIIITSDASLTSFIDHEDSMAFASSQEGVVSLFHGRQFLGLGVKNLTIENIRTFLVELEHLLFNHQPVLKEMTASNTEDALAFQELNYPSLTHTFTLQTQWNYAFKLIDLPEGQPVKQLNLTINPGQLFGKLPLVLYFYVNNELMKSIQLQADQLGPKQVTIPVANDLLKTTNNLNIQAIQAPSSGLCRFANAPVSTQVSGSSTLYQGEASDPPKTFLDIPHAFDHGFHLYLPRYVLEKPEISLTFLTSTATIFPILSLKDVIFYDDHLTDFVPGPFVLMGATPPPGQWHIPLALTGENVTVYTLHNRQKFEVKIRDLMGAMIQLIRHQDSPHVYGLWIPQDHVQKFAQIQGLSLGNTDAVAFKAHGDILFTLKSYQPQKSIFRLESLEQIQVDFTFYTRIATVLFWILAVLLMAKLLLSIKRKRHD